MFNEEMDLKDRITNLSKSINEVLSEIDEYRAYDFELTDEEYRKVGGKSSEYFFN